MGHTKNNKYGHGDEVLVGVEEEEKGCHGPWDLREFVKVMSQGAPCSSTGSFHPIQSVNATHWSMAHQYVSLDTMVQDVEDPV